MQEVNDQTLYCYTQATMYTMAGFFLFMAIVGLILLVRISKRKQI
jgi:DMSO reductase anchor subunit